MANKWAIQNGNWSDGSTWNDGVVPTADDYVYLNGFTVTITNNNTIYADTITDDMNPITQHSGGRIQFQQDVIFICDFLHTANTELLYQTAGGAVRNFTINGDIIAKGTQTAFYGVDLGGPNVVITGNIDISCILFRFSSNYTSTKIFINGNVKSTFNGDFTTSNGTITINGYYDGIHYRAASTNADNISKLTIRNENNYVSNAKISINILEYAEGGLPFILSNLTFLDPENAIIRYVGEVSNPFPYIFVGKNQIETTYPQETEVEEGVIYGASMEKEGVLTLPIESLVMKGVEYGDRVGTLEVIALSGATATADNISVVNLTEQQLQRVANCATVSTVQKCFEEFKE